MQHPSQISSTAATPEIVLAPRDDLFARRAARLEQQARGHSHPDWLTCLAELARQQQKAFNSSVIVPPAGTSATTANANLIGKDEELKPVWQSLYQELFAGMAGTALVPHGAVPLAGNALEQAGYNCLQLARGEILAGARDHHDYLVAAAMQVAWSVAAKSTTVTEDAKGRAHKHCPQCGCEPVGSIVLAGEGKGGLRYLECSLCATRWHAVRAQCTLCDDGHVISYLGLEGGNSAIQAECCDHCHGYVKTYFQEKDPGVDPVADDLTSLTLDVLVGQEGYSRASPNLFLARVEASGSAE